MKTNKLEEIARRWLEDIKEEKPTEYAIVKTLLKEEFKAGQQSVLEESWQSAKDTRGNIDQYSYPPLKKPEEK